MSPTLPCPWFQQCSGCDHCGETLDIQKQRKIQDLETRLLAARIPFPRVEFSHLALGGLRDRLDFTLIDRQLGLYNKDRRQIVDLPDCGQLSPALQSWHTTFREHLPPVSKMSVRLRVSPTGVRGMWLDFANVDVKTLLDEQTWLRSWSDDIIIEIGQKRKRLDRRGSKLKLSDPELFPWFESQYQNQPVPLFGSVGSFTQPSHRANKLITEWIARRTIAAHPQKILEFGTGQGNLSFAALSGGAELMACENDLLALEGFRRSLDHLAAQGPDLRARVQIQAGDFRVRSSPELESADFLLANPARSGLGTFLDPLTDRASLQTILMMSCHPESFTLDAAKFDGKGFRMQELTILDQFPQTKHYEILSLWKKEI